MIWGAWPGYWTRRITWTSDKSGNASSGARRTAHKPQAPRPRAASSTNSRLPRDQRMRLPITVDLRCLSPERLWLARSVPRYFRYQGGERCPEARFGIEQELTGGDDRLAL